MKERKGSYGNVADMLRDKKNKKGGEEEKEKKETFGRSTKTSRSPIRKKAEGKDTGKEEVRGLKEELKDMFRIQREELNEAIKTHEARLSKSLTKKISKIISKKIGEKKNEIVGMLKREMEELKKAAKLREKR